MNTGPRTLKIADARGDVAGSPRDTETGALPYSELDVLAGVVTALQRIERELAATREIAERAERAALDASQDARVANIRVDVIEDSVFGQHASRLREVSGHAEANREPSRRVRVITGIVRRLTGAAGGHRV